MVSPRHPPVLKEHAEKILTWVDDMIVHAALLTLEGDTDPREEWLARITAARLVELRVQQLQRQAADKVHELGGTNSSLAYASGLAEPTTLRKFPKPTSPGAPGQTRAGHARWRTRS